MATPIIKVDVDDSAFKNFKALFDKYQTQVNALPGAWGKVGDATSGASDSFATMTAALLAQQDLLSANRKAADGFAKSTKASVSPMKDLAKSTKETYQNIKKAGTELLKWAGIVGTVGGIIGGAGLFGIDRLAMGTSNQRRAAGGLGVSIGDRRAFTLDYNRFFDADSVLSRVADAKSDYTKRFAFSALGMSQEQVTRQDPVQLAVEMATRAKQIWDRGDGTVQYARAHQLDTFYSMEDLRRLHAASYEELQAQGQHFGTDRGAFGLDEATARKWQNLSTQIDRFGISLETVLIKDLTPLAPSLEHLSASFLKVIDAFLNSETLKRWIKEAADELERFAKYLGSPDVEADVDKFMAAVGRFTTAIGNAVSWLEDKFGVSGDSNAPQGEGNSGVDGSGRQSSWFERSTGLGMAKQVSPETTLKWQQDAEREFWASPKGQDLQNMETTVANRYGVDPDFMKELYRLEDGLKPDGTPAISPAGAIGLGQLMPQTAQYYGVNPYDTTDNAIGSTKYARDLLDQFHGNKLAAAAAYNAGLGRNKASVMHFYETGDESQLPSETRNYVEKMRRDLGLAAAAAGTPDTAQLGGAGGGRNPVADAALERRMKALPPPSDGSQITIYNAPGNNAVVSGAQAAR